MRVPAAVTNQPYQSEDVIALLLGRSEALEEIFLRLSRYGIDLKNIIYAGHRFGIMYSMFPPGLILTSARELTLEAAQSAGSARTVNSRPSNRDSPFAQTKKLLDSRNDREVLEGLRKVISVGCFATLKPRHFLILET